MTIVENFSMGSADWELLKQQVGGKLTPGWCYLYMENRRVKFIHK